MRCEVVVVKESFWHNALGYKSAVSPAVHGYRARYAMKLNQTYLCKASSE